ncbi:MAG: AsmA family protein [Alphaproteobacteria bacterium]|nr:MAG: AsmA family protein [Alphaproteobacteria bacterium]
MNRAKLSIQIAVAGLLACIILPEILPLNLLTPFFLPDIERTLGRKIHVNGLIKLRVFPYIRLVANDIHLENVQGAKHKDMIAIKSLVANVGFMPLLRKKVVLSGRVVRPMVNLEQLSEKQDNWTFVSEETTEEKGAKAETEKNETQPKGSPWVISLEDFKVSGGQVEYRTPGGTKNIHLTTASFGVTTADQGPYFAHLRLVYEGSSYDVSVRTLSPLSDPDVGIVTKFEAGDGRFYSGFTGKFSLAQKTISGKFSAKGSIQKLGLNDILLRHKATHPKMYATFNTQLKATEAMVDLKQTQLDVPMTRITGDANVKLGARMVFDVLFQTLDKESFLRVKTHTKDSALVHGVHLKVDQIKGLLARYDFTSPLEPQAPLEVRGNVLQKGNSYDLSDAVIRLQDAEIAGGFSYQTVAGLMRASANVHLKTLRKWWQVVDADYMPGLDWVKVTASARESSKNVLTFDTMIDMEGEGAVNIKGTRTDGTVKAHCNLHYAEAQHLAHHLTGDKSYKMGPFQIATDVMSQGSKTLLDNIIFHSRPIRGKGSLHVESRGKETHISTSLNLQDLNVTTLLEFLDDDDDDGSVERHIPQKIKDLASRNPVTAKVIDPGWSKKKLLWPQDLFVKAEINIGNVVLVQPLITNSSLRVNMGETLHADFKGKSALTDKPCHVIAHVKPQGGIHHIKLDMGFNEIPFNSIMGTVTNVLSFGGSLTTVAQLATSGSSLDGLMRGLDGHIKIKANKAFIDGVNLIKLSRKPESILGLAMKILFKEADKGLQKALGFFNLASGKNKERTEIFKLRSHIPITKGKLAFIDTILRAEGLEGDINGYVDLASRFADTSGRFILPEIKLKDMPPITFTAKGPFANLVVENTADKLKDYFLNNVVGSLAGKAVTQGLLSVFLPGVGTLIGAVASKAIDSVHDASVDAEIAKERQDRAEKERQKASSKKKPVVSVSSHINPEKPDPKKSEASSTKNGSSKPLKSLEKELKKGIRGLFG